MSFFLLLFKSVLTFFATEIDDFLVFVLLFNKNQGKKQKTVIILAQIIVLIFVTVLCGFVAFFLSKIPFKYLRFLGLLPLMIGIVSIFKKEEQKEEKETSGKLWGLFFTTAILVLAASGDNLGIYIPLFLNMEIWQKIIVLVVFVMLQIVWSFLQIKASQLGGVQKIIETSGRFIEPVVFIGLGILILLGI